MPLIALYCIRQSRAPNQGHRPNGSAVRVSMDRRNDGQMDGRYQVHYLPRFVDAAKYIISLASWCLYTVVPLLPQDWTIALKETPWYPL